MNFRESHIVTPGPYRATKLWNEVTKLFRAGMPLKKHRQHFRLYGSCFTASAAVDWLHELLRNNSNFGPEVTRQQTVQLLKKFLKNHVIEDVKGKWGSEDIEDNSQLYRFPPTSPLKPIPRGPQPKRNKNSSMKEKDVFFKFRNSKKFDPETQENVCPSNQDTSDYSTPKVVRRRELTEDDILDVWREITLTHLQKTLGLTSFEDVLHPNQINCQHIVYNMTNVNKHGVVTLDDKTGDLPHWVLSAMKCLANWPKYDSNQPSYPGFERDVFKTVSDYFLNLPQPLLTYEYYELFVNVLVLCGYIVVPNTQRGKRKNHEELGYPHPTKAPHLAGANVFRSTECLLYSLIRKEAFDEPDSPMTEVFGCKELPRCSVAEMDASKSSQLRDVCHRRGSAGDTTGGRGGAASVRHRPRSCSLEGIIDYPADSPSQPVGESAESLALSSSEDGSVLGTLPPRKAASLFSLHPKVNRRAYASMTSLPSSISSERGDLDICSQIAGDGSQLAGESQPAGSAIMSRPSSICNHTGIDKYRKMSASCFSINAPVAEITMKPDYSSSVGLRRPHMFNGTAGRTEVRAGPCVGRRCLSSVDLSHKPALSLPTVNTLARHLSLDQSLLQPQLERVAVEALQLCTLLLPPASRRKLQLLMRMISRMSQNVDMPRLHEAIGTRTLMVHTFSRCVLRCEEELDLDELLATRLVSFLMDHHQEILQVPVYLQNAVQDHIAYLRKVQVSYPGSGIGITPPAYSFCRQISSQEFEEQKMSVSQAAIADLLESLVKDKTLPVKEKKKRLKQFQKEYPDIYRRRFPTTESEAQLFADKPKIKPPMLISMKKSKAFSIRN